MDKKVRAKEEGAGGGKAERGAPQHQSHVLHAPGALKAGPIEGRGFHISKGRFNLTDLIFSLPSHFTTLWRIP